MIGLIIVVLINTIASHAATHVISTYTILQVKLTAMIHCWCVLGAKVQAALSHAQLQLTYCSNPGNVLEQLASDRCFLRKYIQYICIQFDLCYILLLFLLIYFTHSIQNYLTDTGTILRSLQWLHNERKGVSNHQPHYCLLNCLFRPRSKETSNLGVTRLCAGNSPLTSEFPE